MEIAKTVSIYLEKRKNVYMMKINIDIPAISNLLIELKKTKEEYELTYKKIFSTLENTSFFWQDNIALEFYNDIENEKIKNEKVLNNMSLKIEVIEYIYNNYKSLGNNININLNSIEHIIDKINIILNNIQNIISRYNQLPNDFNYYEIYYFNQEKKKLKKNYSKLDEIKNKIIEYQNKILKIEKEINSKLSEIENIKIKEFNEAKYMRG